MLRAKIGFVVFGVHKDGLKDPMGVPFIDEELIAQAKNALRHAGLELVGDNLVVASRKEARERLAQLKKMDEVDAVVLFSGTWVWAAHLVGALRDFAGTGKGIVLWTHPGSQGWRPVGGLVLHGALKEIGLAHRFVYGGHDDPLEMARIVSYCRASAMKNRLNQSVIGAFGGRGMGQTCGAADPSQWMKVFGVDIDPRDTTELIKMAQAVTGRESKQARPAHSAGQNFRAIHSTLYRAEKNRHTGGLGVLHHPILARTSQRLQRHLFRPEHDAGGWMWNINAGGLQHGHDGEATDRFEPRACVLWRLATHRQGQQGDQNYWRRRLSAFACRQTWPGGIRPPWHSDRR
jgi:hypothetical protein